MRISDWSSDVCSSDLAARGGGRGNARAGRGLGAGAGRHRSVGRDAARDGDDRTLSGPCRLRSEEHTSELQSLMRISYAVFCLKKKISNQLHNQKHESPIQITKDNRHTL